MGALDGTAVFDAGQLGVAVGGGILGVGGGGGEVVLVPRLVHRLQHHVEGHGLPALGGAVGRVRRLLLGRTLWPSGAISLAAPWHV